MNLCKECSGVGDIDDGERTADVLRKDKLDKFNIIHCAGDVPELTRAIKRTHVTPSVASRLAAITRGPIRAY